MCELTINLVLGFEASSAAPSEEVWSFGLLHEDHLQRTCRGSSRRVSWQNLRVQWCENSDASHLMGLSVCLRSGAQMQSVSPQGSLHQWTKDSGLNLEHKLTSPWHKKDPSAKMLIRLTGKCSKYSEETQESHIRPGHFCVVSGLRWRDRPGGKGVSKRWGQETGGISAEGGGIDSVWQTKAASEALENFTDQYWVGDIFVCCDSSVSLYVHFRLE